MPHGPEADAELASTGTLVRQSIRSLYLTGRFLDLPDTMKVHPGMQARLRAIQPEMDDAVLGMTARLERMTAEDHRSVQAHLQKDDLFGERLARVLEKTASDDGLSFQRTFGVRSATLELSRRMAAQSPGARPRSARAARCAVSRRTRAATRSRRASSPRASERKRSGRTRNASHSSRRPGRRASARRARSRPAVTRGRPPPPRRLRRPDMPSIRATTTKRSPRPRNPRHRRRCAAPARA